MTTAHLPECIYTPEHFDPEQNIIWGGNPCICRALRACEERVRQGMESLAHLYEQDAYMRGWSEALDAAREAVAAILPHYGKYDGWVMRDEPLAAIDALRNPPSLPPTTGRAYKY